MYAQHRAVNESVFTYYFHIFFFSFSIFIYFIRPTTWLLRLHLSLLHRVCSAQSGPGAWCVCMQARKHTNENAHSGHNVVLWLKSFRAVTISGSWCVSRIYLSVLRAAYRFSWCYNLFANVCLSVCVCPPSTCVSVCLVGHLCRVCIRRTRYA